MSENIMKELEKKAAKFPRRVVFPEGEVTEILSAAAYVSEQGIAKPILIGKAENIKANAEKAGVSLKGIEICNIPLEEEITKLSIAYEKSGGALSAKGFARKMRQPLYYAAMMVKSEMADAMVAGFVHSTAEVILAGQTIIGMQEGITTPSSIFLMDIPNFEGSEGELIVFADCGVCLNPGAKELADIAVVSAQTTKKILDWDPRIAMLSFSTKGSVEHESLDKIPEAIKLVQEFDPYIKIDGELQLDAAIIPQIAKKKVPGESSVAGKANILIFPDLNAGNICYKAVQRFAGGNAYGPFLQGFAKTISDLSRGSSVSDIIGVTTMAVICAASE